MSPQPQVTLKFRSQSSQKRVRRDAVPAGRVPRIAKLMALAIRFEQLIRDGTVANQAEIARLGHVSRARVTQIMNLLNLGPDIQEAILWLPPVEKGRDSIYLRHVLPIAAEPDWEAQSRMWQTETAEKSHW